MNVSISGRTFSNSSRIARLFAVMRYCRRFCCIEFWLHCVVIIPCTIVVLSRSRCLFEEKGVSCCWSAATVRCCDHGTFLPRSDAWIWVVRFFFFESSPLRKYCSRKYFLDGWGLCICFLSAYFFIFDFACRSFSSTLGWGRVSSISGSFTTQLLVGLLLWCIDEHVNHGLWFRLPDALT